jgi:PAT family beta-lactamase induction signal transducer AmpG
MAKTDAPDAPVPAPPRRRAVDVLRALGRPKVGLMLALGFSSGLPFMLFGNTLGLWLAEDKIAPATIGFLSWVCLPYLLQFVWGAAVDRVRLPLLGRLGRRRSWMVLTQVGVAAGLLGMSAADPQAHLGRMAVFAILTSLAGATQDTVINAWRIESAVDGEELGLLTSAYTLGYRGALIATEALILIVAQHLGWPLAYALYGGAMAVGVAAALLASEPEKADQVMEAKRSGALAHPLRTVIDTVVGPFIVFFRTHGVGLAALMLGMITVYHLCDYMRGPMSGPFYIAMGITKPTIAIVRLTFGLAGSLSGVALGGIVILRIGILRSLVIGAIAQPVGIAAFAILARHGGDFDLISTGPFAVTAFQAIMGFDSLAIGFSGVALASYMSTLTTLGYTATQYALLTSAMAWTGKTLKGFSGLMVETLRHGRGLIEAYGDFYLWAAALGAPAVLLCLILAARPTPTPIQSVRQTT